MKQYRINNREYRSAYNKQYEIDHKEALRARRRRYRKVNRDKIQRRQNNWAKANPAKTRSKRLRRRARMYSLAREFTSRDLSRMMDYWHDCCAYCGAQRDFWHTIECDHFIPVSDTDNSPGTVVENMLPACRYCNSSKRTAPPAKWLVSRFGSRRAAEILTRIETYFRWATEQGG